MIAGIVRDGWETRGGGRGQPAEASARRRQNLAGRAGAARLGRACAGALRFAVPARIREWAAVEVGAGRLLPWFAVAFGTGIVIYFSADTEPAWWAASALAVAAAVAAVLLRRRAVAFVVALGLFAICAGFAVATLKTALIAHPLLRYPASRRVVDRLCRVARGEPKDRPLRAPRRPDRGQPDRREAGACPAVRAPRHGTARRCLRRGESATQSAVAAVAAGSYDFARDLYFQRIGASGFVHGAIKVVTPPAAASVPMRANAFIQGLRDTIDRRIRSVLPGDVGSIASALITGKRDAITPHVYDAMFVSGIGHVLSISGYHMAVVAGVVFFIVRALLALIPGLADRVPIKKWAAFAALLVTAFYLVLSGAEVATQRSFIMIAVVLVGVMLDRPVLTLRSVTIAALWFFCLRRRRSCIRAFRCRSRRRLALVAVYAHGLPLARPGRNSSLGARAALWGVNEIVGLVAGVARRGPRHDAVCGVPLPPHCALWRARQSSRHADRLRLGDADGHPRCTRHAVRLRRRILAADGYGIEWMDAVALWVASLPGRVRPRDRIRHRSAVAGHRRLLLIGLLKTPLRWSGAAACRSSRASGRRARRCRTFLSPPTDVCSRCGRRTAGSPSITPAAILSRSGNGSPPMPTAVTPRSRAWQGHRLRSVGLHRQARRRALCPMQSRPMRSRRIAAAPQ